MKLFNKKISVKLSMAVIVITILLISVVVIFAAGDFAVPYTFTSGATISSSEVNANFQAIGGNLPASKTSATSGTVNITSTSEYQTLANLTVTPSSSGYLLVFGHATLSSLSGSDSPAVQFCMSKNDSAGIQSADTKCEGLSSQDVIDSVYPQGAVTAGTTLYYSLKSKIIGGTGVNAVIQGAYLSAVFIPAPNQLP
jgi:hypothetical protein